MLLQQFSRVRLEYSWSKPLKRAASSERKDRSDGSNSDMDNSNGNAGKNKRGKKGTRMCFRSVDGVSIPLTDAFYTSQAAAEELSRLTRVLEEELLDKNIHSDYHTTNSNDNNASKASDDQRMREAEESVPLEEWIEL